MYTGTYTGYTVLEDWYVELSVYVLLTLLSCTPQNESTRFAPEQSTTEEPPAAA